MKSVAEKLRMFHRKLSLNLSSPSVAIRNFQISTTAATESSAGLTEEEVKQINAVVPRLCSSNHLKEAIQLMSAALSTANPPLNALPLSILINRLALEPDLTHHMHLLNALKFNPNTGNPFVLIPIAKMFVSSFFERGHPKKAVKMFQWVSRPDFPGGVADDSGFYAVLIDGFCKSGMIFDALRVLRLMASENLVVGNDVRMWVYRGLLREARVREALELNAALDCCALGSDDGAFGSKEVVDLLDRMIASWVE
ncbi:pentatricopeptide repeat-containing protein At1g12775, mitochondrial-like [Sesamum indicum]|uniref:Pentatricopeptide repeat-containing protein At1g12775, mitochondrial-like n=1 Tax=Sesamum indicum TaxID=4182 RepID=A0A6I9TEG0_SESIN|nr:pentatricopeptide repeat-containing protein At1g12775, mitochondrial-like [Sesamum indicum]